MESTKQTQKGEEQIELPVYTLEQLGLRNGRSTREIWVAYRGLIYDVTESPLFKNGRHYKLDTGRDLTSEMEKAPHLDDVLKDWKIAGKLQS